MYWFNISTSNCTAKTEGCVEKTALLLQRQLTQRTVKLVTEMVLIWLFSDVVTRLAMLLFVKALFLLRLSPTLPSTCDIITKCVRQKLLLDGNETEWERFH